MNDKMHPIGKCRTDFGFTLIEMIGVLAVIAVLVALLLPRVFEIMAESKANALVAAVATYRTAIVKYYADMGTILPLDAGGTPMAQSSGDTIDVESLGARLTLDKEDPLNTGSNSWANFQGPYLAHFSSDSPPGFGTHVFMPVRDGPSYGTPTTAINRGYDFDNDGNSDLPTNAHVAFLRFRSVAPKDFERIDNMLDSGFGGTALERQLRGRVKYDVSTNRMRIYLMHK
ncbi:MAG: hypothetical protein NPIRA02_19040 [Nitrospirales bacterium]|nr:MAG: hypothetical protein NPIRA02_19040 [Nitrospirales bacterium]